MRSKRKEVNKFRVKEVKPIEDEDDLLRRTSGTKPFQLNKLRTTKRISEWAHISPISLRNHAEYNDCYLDLLVNKKLIAKEVAVPPPEKRTNFYPNQQERVKKQLAALNYKSITIDEGQVNEPGTNEEIKLFDEEYDQSKEESILFSQKQQEQKAESVKNTDKIETIRKMPPAQSMTFYDNGKSVVVPEKSMRLRDKAALPPFSFTNYKWRSKSELVGIDKWKAKYGQPQRSASMKQFKEQQSTANQQFPTQKDIQRFIEYKKRTQDYRSPRKSKPKLQPVLNPTPEPKSNDKKKLDSESVSSQLDNPERMSNSNVLHSQNDIVIRKMFAPEQTNVPYEDKKDNRDDKTDAKIESQKQDATPKKKNGRKFSFPEIKVVKYGKLEKEAAERNRGKIDPMNRTSNWRSRAKKVDLEQIMEEAPERWEMAQSRQKVTGEEVDVGDYMQIKKEQEEEREKEREKECLRAISEAAEADESIVLGEPPALELPKPPIKEMEKQLLIAKKA